MHTSQGLANSAFSDKRPSRAVQILHWNGEEWEVTKEYSPGDNCEKCGGSFNANGVHPYINRYIAWWGAGRKMDEPVICRKCYDEDYQAHSAQKRREREQQEYERLKAKFE